MSEARRFTNDQIHQELNFSVGFDLTQPGGVGIEMQLPGDMGALRLTVTQVEVVLEALQEAAHMGTALAMALDCAVTVLDTKTPAELNKILLAMAEFMGNWSDRPKKPPIVERVNE